MHKMSLPAVPGSRGHPPPPAAPGPLPRGPAARAGPCPPVPSPRLCPRSPLAARLGLCQVPPPAPRRSVPGSRAAGAVVTFPGAGVVSHISCSHPQHPSSAAWLRNFSWHLSGHPFFRRFIFSAEHPPCCEGAADLSTPRKPCVPGFPSRSGAVRERAGAALPALG